ncbi:hypothetical protein DTO271D3_3473 [Paecilomyces variotii]|nr:hypothetical protein DTO169C6_1289 [Paecilomyces variotii]KAJ9316204.1 hypothetical protein DTO271D3_3473 [Paecilomyces variotii]KAJ9328264.1 hypothetical protein DTO027B3_1301 [Paecilomyces variotii]KAJ9336444.1 hypothetical protein DTO027B5_1759 [Paecilomyces variotii]
MHFARQFDRLGIAHQDVRVSVPVLGTSAAAEKPNGRAMFWRCLTARPTEDFKFALDGSSFWIVRRNSLTDYSLDSAGTHARHVVEESPTRFKQPTDSPAFTRPGFNLEVILLAARDDLLIPASGLIITPSTEPSTHRSEHSRHIDDLADTCRCRNRRAILRALRGLTHVYHATTVRRFNVQSGILIRSHWMAEED